MVVVNTEKLRLLCIFVFVLLICWFLSNIFEKGNLTTHLKQSLLYASDSAYLKKILGETNSVYAISDNSSLLPSSARISGILLFKKKPLVMWASEWHMTPTKDLRSLLEPFGVRFLEYSLDPGHCDWHDCERQKGLKILNTHNVLSNDPPIPTKFYEAYKDDPEMKSVDVFFCGYPVSLCEMFAPFNKSVLVLASTRYQISRPESRCKSIPVCTISKNLKLSSLEQSSVANAGITQPTSSLQEGPVQLLQAATLACPEG